MGSTEAAGHSYLDYLKREFEGRVRRNGRYSLRAFARDLGIPASNLTEILQKRRGLSVQTASRMSMRLKLGADEAEYFVASVEAEHGRSEAAREGARGRLRALESASGFSILSLETYEVIADWIHFGLMELTEIAGGVANAARRFRSSPERVRAALSRLEKLGLMERRPDGEWRQTAQDLATPDPVSSRAIRAHHAQVLGEALDALETVPPEQREFSTMIFAVDSSRVEEAKRELRRFRRRFCKEIQDGGSKDRVYCLGIQLFPLDRETKEKS